MRIIQCTRKDVEAIAELHLSVLPSTSTAIGKRYLRYLYNLLLTDQNHKILVAKQGSLVIGFISVTTNWHQTIKQVGPPKAAWFIKDCIGALLFGKLSVPSLYKRFRFERYIQTTIQGTMPTILTLGVFAKAQRQGIGKKLVHAVMKQYSSSRIKEIYVDTETRNVRAVSFYRSIGFVKLNECFGNVLLKKNLT